MPFAAELYRENIVLMKICSKVNELDEEKMKTEEALHDFLPVSVVRSMKVLILFAIEKFNIYFGKGAHKNNQIQSQ